MVEGFSRLRGIMRTVHNQYDSLVQPLKKWLEERNVQFRMGAQVDDVEFTDRDGEKYATALLVEQDGARVRVLLGADDLLIATLGSMTEASSIGTMDKAPELHAKHVGCSWTLWETIAQGRPELGRPKRFCERVQESKWLSFTVTQRTRELLDHIRDLTGNVPGEGGLVTFCDSNWLMSIVVPHQPHFIGQPDGVQVFWGYALSMDQPGNFVNKPIGQCTGREIMAELFGHLGVTQRAEAILHDTICLPCLMPFITSQFLTRATGDRPQVHPKGYANFAVIGQFCEQPEDVVFTVEYSVRSAMTAAYELLGLARKPPSVFKGQYHPRYLVKALRALHDAPR
jgi:oleate hydratase